ncbi:hypothetical protein B0H14DRAFT_2689005, partial [Mycena olivaceomarginata]
MSSPSMIMLVHSPAHRGKDVRYRCGYNLIINGTESTTSRAASIGTERRQHWPCRVGLKQPERQTVEMVNLTSSYSPTPTARPKYPTTTVRRSEVMGCEETVQTISFIKNHVRWTKQKVDIWEARHEFQYLHQIRWHHRKRRYAEARPGARTGGGQGSGELLGSHGRDRGKYLCREPSGSVLNEAWDIIRPTVRAPYDGFLIKPLTRVVQSGVLGSFKHLVVAIVADCNCSTTAKNSGVGVDDKGAGRVAGIGRIA